MTDYSEGFWITMTGLIIGFLGLSVKMCLRSKCDSVDLCCLKIHRNVEVEEKAEEIELKYGVYDGQKGNKEENV